MKLSIVTSLYCSGAYINEFYLRISDAVRSLPEVADSYEIIFVNDGSPDDSLAKATLLARVDEHIRIIDLSRNFGHHKALLTGIQRAQGDYVFLVDSDLEEKPELLVEFWQELQSEPELDVVFGVQARRRGNWLDRHVAGLFYSVFNFLSETQVIGDQLVARLMRRRYVDSLAQFTEADIVLIGICTLAGHRQKPYAVEKGYKKTTTYGLGRKLRVLVDVITSFSARPLELIFVVGLFAFSVSLVALAVLIVSKLMIGSLIGWTSLCASIWLLGGLILMSQGVIGLYVAKIFRQVKQRPFSLVRYDSTVDSPQEVTSKPAVSAALERSRAEETARVR